jgi:hypothetical protein
MAWCDLVHTQRHCRHCRLLLLTSSPVSDPHDWINGTPLLQYIYMHIPSLVSTLSRELLLILAFLYMQRCTWGTWNSPNRTSGSSIHPSAPHSTLLHSHNPPIQSWICCVPYWDLLGLMELLTFTMVDKYLGMWYSRKVVCKTAVLRAANKQATQRPASEEPTLIFSKRYDINTAWCGELEVYVNPHLDQEFCLFVCLSVWSVSVTFLSHNEVHRPSSLFDVFSIMLTAYSKHSTLVYPIQYITNLLSEEWFAISNRLHEDCYQPVGHHSRKMLGPQSAG